MKQVVSHNLDLRTRIGKLGLETPIICASGTFGFGIELENLVDFRYIGAFVTKTITLKSKKGNLPPRIIEVDCGVLNSIGLENPGLEVFIKEKLPQIKKLPGKFVVSVGGKDLEEYKEIVRRLQKIKDVESMEINLSCPNIKTKKMISQNAGDTLRTVKSLRKLTGKTLIVKLSGEAQELVKVAKAAEKGGAEAISLVNTFFGMGVDIKTKKPYLGEIYGGYSGKGIKPLSLYRVWQVAKNVTIPVIGGGGISEAKDAIEFILAGAKAVSIGTINLVHPNSAKDILKGIIKYMRINKINSLDKIVGSLKILNSK